MLQHWDLLTAPSKRIQKPQDAQAAHILSSVLILYVTCLIAVVEIPPLLIPGLVPEVVHQIGHISILLYLALYTLSRTRYFRLAAYGCLALLFVSVFTTVIVDRRLEIIHGSYGWLTIGTLICSIVLPFWQSALFAALNAVGIAVLAFALPETHFKSLFIDLPPITILSALILTGAALRNRAERNLNLAKEEAERANFAKSRFLAAMSHEIRSPLGVVLGFTDILAQNDVTPDERQKFREMVTRNGTHLLSLINEVLDLSRVESGKLEVKLAPVKVREEVQALVVQHRMLASKKGVNINLDIAADVPGVLQTDPLRLRQALHNLLSNAVKFTEHGEVKIKVRADGASTRFSVEDSGIGITPESRNKLFEPFVQDDGRKYGGAGLGLALSKKLAKLLGGDLELEWSEPGRGSRFILVVPSETTEPGLRS